MKSSRSRRFVVGTLLLATLTGCCATVPRADKYFHRDWDFTETLRQFQFAVETGQNDIAYECLSPPDQAEFGPTKFELFLWFGRVEALRDVRARDAIADAVYTGDWGWSSPDETQAWAELEYTNEQKRVGATILFHLVKIPIEGREFPDEGEWRLDLLTTATQFVMSE